jgi:hypothetical protein
MAFSDLDPILPMSDDTWRQAAELAGSAPDPLVWLLAVRTARCQIKHCDESCPPDRARAPCA